MESAEESEPPSAIDGDEEKGRGTPSQEKLDPLIYAIAPKLHAETEEQVDLTVTPAYLCLDQVSNSNFMQDVVHNNFFLLIV